MALDITWRPSMNAVLFIVDSCKYCDQVKPQVIELFDRAAITLEVRKATLQELQKLKLRGFPSLFLPKATPPVVVSGSDIPKWLTLHPEAWREIRKDRQNKA